MEDYIKLGNDLIFAESYLDGQIRKKLFKAGTIIDKISFPSAPQVSEVSDLTVYPQENDDPPSTALSSNFNNFSAANTVDDDTGTKGWDTNGNAVGDYLNIDLGDGNEKAFVRMGLYLNQAGYDGAFKVRYSDDGSTWKDATTSDWTPNQEGWNYVSWPWVGKHRYWRLELTTASTAIHGDFMEMSLYAISPVSCVHKKSVVVKPTFSSNSANASIRLFWFDYNGVFIGISEAVTINASSILDDDGERYLPDEGVQMFDNDVGAASFLVNLDSLSAGDISFALGAV